MTLDKSTFLLVQSHIATSLAVNSFSCGGGDSTSISFPKLILVLILGFTEYLQAIGNPQRIKAAIAPIAPIIPIVSMSMAISLITLLLFVNYFSSLL